MAKQVRVRFAPSPTGYLHLGSARTAIFNWLYARHTGGKFILRIEDTDRERSKKEYLDEILEDLKWMGIEWDEGPFAQSEKMDVYRKKAEAILKKDLAYREGNAIIYKVEKSKIIKISDLIHGEIQFNTDEIKDQVLIKSDGSPAYNFACVVDDSEMEITHIIRGDDHISNTPKQIMLYEALSLKPPHFAHMPLMMGKDGAKLSKRHGGVAVFEYKNEGFLPEALANYLILLGWSPGGDREIIGLKEAAEKFDIKDINNVQVTFDIDKLRWINGEYIRSKTASELFPKIKEKLIKEKYVDDTLNKDHLLNIIELYKTRFKTFDEFLRLTECFFRDNYSVDDKAYKKHLENKESKKRIGEFAEKLKLLNEFSAPKIEEICRQLADSQKVKASKIIHPTRVAISGLTVGAGLFEIMEVLGKAKVIVRLEKAVSNN
ncbi:MAG: glutamate--tRNA ligase [Candidatus Omnitrophica bacterium]|nr:glutamate--tRNA ligase [Candidatus Omnitrophota bacterium]